jgi:hypothetical protein
MRQKEILMSKPDNQSLGDQLLTEVVKALLKVPGVKENVHGFTELFYRQFDATLDIEKEVPGAKHVYTDGDIHLAVAPLEYDETTDTLEPSKSAMAALTSLAAAGRLSDEKTDPTPEECAVLVSKAKQTERYKEVFGGTVSVPSDSI